MKKTLLIAAACAAAVLSQTATASAQTLTLTNNAGLSHSSVLAFERAAANILNGSYRNVWHTPFITWSNSHHSQNLLLVNNENPVDRACGPGAAGCHYVNSRGAAAAIVNTSLAQTGRIWQVAATHELEEMTADPFIRHFVPMPNADQIGLPGARWLVEVADPVEDFVGNVRGVPVSDFVTPAWYSNDGSRQQDDLNKLPFYGVNQYGFSCPTGFAYYKYQGRFISIVPSSCNGIHTATTSTTAGAAPAGMRVTARIAAKRFIPILPILSH